MSYKIIIAGAGPGAEDLITLRALNALKQADLVVYAGSLVNHSLLDNCPDTCTRLNSASMSLEEVLNVMEDYWRQGKRVVRLHSGDPAIYGAISEQMNEMEKRGMEYEVVPGVSCAFAAAAALKCEYTMPGITQSIILTRRQGRTPVPEAENLRKLAANEASLAIYLSIGDIDGVVEDLLAAGRDRSTPVAVVYRASWPNEKIIRGTLDDIAEKTKNAGINRQALIVVGKAVTRGGKKSLLYDNSFAHGYRNKSAGPLFRGRTAIYAITEKGAYKALEIKEGMQTETDLFVPERFASKFPSASSFSAGTLSALIENNWNSFDAHVFVMATGIVVRKIRDLIKSKLSDPAVVVCDETGSYIISLLSGHIGGANRLARSIAGITGGKAVITTATDVNGLTAFDEVAGLNRWKILNPSMIKTLNAKLLEAAEIDLLIPEDVFNANYANVRGLRLVKSVSEISTPYAVVLDAASPDGTETLKLASEIYTMGIGCRRGTSADEIENAVIKTLEKLGISMANVAKFATTIHKMDEKGLLDFAEKNSVTIDFIVDDTLNSIKTPNSSPKAMEQFGLSSVAEAAALVSAQENAEIILEKTVYGSVTTAVAAGTES